MTVIDTSALSRFIMREQDWKGVIPYLDPKAVPYTVELAFTEATNVIGKYIIKHLIDTQEGMEFFNDLLAIYESQIIVIEENMKYASSALSIGVTYNIPVYDSLFLAQAQHHNTTLVTCDAKQANIADELKIPVELI